MIDLNLHLSYYPNKAEFKGKQKFLKRQKTAM